MSNERAQSSQNDIAIIGLAGRFPGAKDIDAFWANLRDGVESITQFTDAELRAAGIDPAMLSDPRYVKAHAALDDVDLFDAAFFGLTPREAEIMDPQQRLFLECSWEALENAGYDPERYEGAIGVFASTLVSSYMLSNLYSNHELLASLGALAVRIANDRDFLPTRVSYKLNLTGPSVCVQTACSSSLVGCHLACQSLLDYQCDIALAGGVAIAVPQQAGYFYQAESIFSPDGHCRAFDARAQGTVMGSGIGIVVLKRLEDALEDGDLVRAVIKGSAINNDGALKIGYTAPSVEGQAAAIVLAQAVAQVDAETISYIEAHGTGTTLGDPIEIAALTQAFRESTEKKRFCAIGSVKTNIGHLDPAAGVAGLIKTVLALEHRLIPPSLNFETPNPAIDFSTSPFYVNATLDEWKPGRTPRRAGVSSFAVGGTNAHVVLEEAPPRPTADPSARPEQLLVLSAKTATALQQATSDLAAYLQRQPGEQLADVAYTLQIGRRAWDHRRILVCRDREDAATALLTLDSRRVYSYAGKPATRPIVFMFPGQGAQYAGMGRELYRHEPVFREWVDRCAALLRPHLELDIRSMLYPDEDDKGTRRQGDKENQTDLVTLSPGHLVSADGLEQTQYAQPALFVVEYALAQLWMNWGVYPEALIGHSVGEYVAACLAGVLTLEDALALVAARGRLIQALPPGAMLAIPLPWAEVAPLLDDAVACAAINGPSLCAIAGPPNAVHTVQAQLAARGIDCRRLHTSHAFHSPMMDVIVGPFFEQVQKMRLRSPQIPYVSNVTGTWITTAEATDPGYWAKHLRQTVQFWAGLASLPEKGILLEVGPGRMLSTLAHQHSDAPNDALVLTSMRHPQEQRSDVELMLTTLGRLWLAGTPVEWQALYAHEQRRRVSLPTYPFERRRYWIEPASAAGAQRFPDIGAPQSPESCDQFYTPVWKETLLPSPFRPDAQAAERAGWVIFADAGGLGQHLATRLKQLGQDVMVVRPGGGFQQLSDSEWAIAPSRPEDYRALCEVIARWEGHSTHIVHLWSLAIGEPRSGHGIAGQDAAPGLHSLVLLADALGQQAASGSSHVIVVTNHAQAVAEAGSVDLARSALPGLADALSREYPAIRCRSVDVRHPGAGPAQEQKLVELLIAELVARSPEPVVAYRGNQRWARSLEARQLDEARADSALLHKDGVYLFTDGLSDIALDLAAHLVATTQARLILLNRAGFPDRSEWARLAAPAEHDGTFRKIERLRALEDSGAQIMIEQADLADPHSLRTLIAQAERRFGRIHGVVHELSPTAGGASSIAPVSDLAACAGVIRAEVSALEALAAALDGLELDFVLLAVPDPRSSHPGPRAVQAALGSLVESCVRRHNQEGIVPWIGAAWDHWGSEQAYEQRGDDRMAEPAGVPAAETLQRMLTLGAAAHIVVSSSRQPGNERLARARGSEEQQVSKPDTPGHHERPALSNTYVAPENEIEQALAAIWQQLLGIAQVGIHDNFFELGGQSLLATQALSRIQDTFEADISLAGFFEAATIAELARQIEQRRQKQEQRPAAGIPVSEREEAPELSFAQQRMWLLDRLDPGNPLYNLCHAIRLVGRLDLAALNLGVNDVVRRHELLRTAFPAVAGQPVQQIASALRLPLPLVDLQGCPEAVQETAARRLIRAEMQHRFDLASAPLVRVGLLRLADAEHVLVLNMHHIISDGWSLGVLVDELTAHYLARSRGASDALPALPIQYADFALWQRRRLQGAFLESQLAYWKAHLSGVPALQLPTDHPRPSVQTYHSASLPLAYSPALAGALRRLSRQADGTLFMAQLTGFAALLGRMAHQTDFCVGSLVANRNQPEIERLIGFFVNNLPIRVDLSGRPSAVALLARVRAATLGAYDHQDVPFEQVLDAVQPARDTSRTPLFQVMCVLQNFPQPLQRIPDLTLHPLPVNSYRSGFDLTFWLWEAGDGLSGELEYNPDLFEPDTIMRLAGHLHVLLTEMTADPTRPVTDLALLTDAEQRELLAAWNGDSAAYPREQCVHSLFEAQVERTPDAVAVIFDAAMSNDEGRKTNDEGSDSSFVLRPWSIIQLTYSELNARANQLAHYVRKLGVAPGTPVGLLLPRSPELVIGALGILKAGAAYVPLDPAYPAERLAFMIADSRAAVLVRNDGRMTNDERRTTNDLEETQTPIVNRKSKIVNLVADWPAIACEPATSPNSGASPANPVYIIYTSGSTGQPKGAAVYHRGFVNLASWFIREFTLTSQDRVLLMTSFSFDLTQKNLFAPLIAGAAIQLAPPGRYDAVALRAIVAAGRITRLNCTPSAFYPLVEPGARRGGTKLVSLRSVFLGGEPIATARLLDWLASDDCRAEVINTYGPTECTDVVAFHRLARPDLSPGAPVPIGKAISNIQLLVLDAQLQLAPIGTTGELYVAGVGVGMGYVGDSALTAEKFIVNPFVTNDEGRMTNDEFNHLASLSARHLGRAGTRLYRTGDLVRARPDGTMLFVGRIDDQVKVRGFRIELGEIETTLARHPMIRECAVVARADHAEDVQLVAYVVPTNDERRTTNDESEPSSFVLRSSSLINELRTFVKQQLPDYMLPAAFILLDVLPLTASGKLDRRALPAPDQAWGAAGDGYVAPRTPVEEALAGIWSRLLSVSRVGATDHFFRLGGHSLLAMRLIFEIQETFEINLPLSTLFEQPTVEELALVIEEILIKEITNLSEEEAQALDSSREFGFI